MTTYPLSPTVTAFSTTRHGGRSEGSYASFNINPFCGDNPEHVAQNLELLVRKLGIDTRRIIIPHQIHRVESRMIAEDFFRLPAAVQATILEGVDCVMTQVPGVCVGVSTADCLPLLYHDPTHHAVAAAHAGWRGTAARIAHKTLTDMYTCFGTNPQDVQVVIGPGIHVEHFEVGQEVYDTFAHTGNDMTRIAAQYENQNEEERAVQPLKWHIDLPLCNRIQLEQAGVKPENITVSPICTYANHSDYFSARRLGTDSGRIYTGIVIH